MTSTSIPVATEHTSLLIEGGRGHDNHHYTHHHHEHHGNGDDCTKDDDDDDENQESGMEWSEGLIDWFVCLFLLRSNVLSIVSS